MCNKCCIDFGKRNLKEEDVRGKSIIEVGSLNINGSLRATVENFGPDSYVGVDIKAGPGVDQICGADDLIEKFGCNKFDILICTELLEHVKNWQHVIHNLKNILKPSGILIITTRSKGFRYHGFPFDFWRYEKSDLEFIFSDFDIEVLEKDLDESGIFLKARKRIDFVEKELKGYRLYSIIQNRRSSIIINNIYFLLVSFPVQKIFRNNEYAGIVMHCNAFPFEIPLLVKRKFVKLLKQNHFKKIICFM
jgi:SAM-dependent methyltransferase